MPHAAPEPHRSPPASLALDSDAFADGAALAAHYTADGEDRSPPLAWTPGPSGTRSYAILCEDPDAPSGRFTHWLVWNIDPDRTKLPEGISDETVDVRQGENDFGRIGWDGPSPPRGSAHRYVFRVYALDTRLALKNGASRERFDRALEGHVIAHGRLTGKYGR